MLRRELLARFVLALRKDKMAEAEALIRKFTGSGEVTAASLLVRQDSYNLARGYGTAQANTPFLLASITKPMTAGAVMVLRDRGELSLKDPVRKYLPKFTGNGRDGVTIRHLLTHTSGLPDMLPENEDLRRRHAPLEEFVERTYKTPLLFKPGAEVRYQSMGILLASAVVEHITRTPLRDFLKREIFQPLGMRDASLGLGGRPISAMAPSQVPEKTNWDWNSQYWRDLGAPWGGAHATTDDVAKYLLVFQTDGSPIWKSGTTKEMISNQTSGYKQAWGLGWRLNAETYGQARSTSSYGHSGSTGTIAWSDPATRTTCILLTSKPAAQSQKPLLTPVCNFVSEAAKS
jgi:CubicO group peptidase (beta-lactamase class C family)